MKALKSQRARELLAQPQFAQQLRRALAGHGDGKQDARITGTDRDGRTVSYRVEAVSRPN